MPPYHDRRASEVQLTEFRSDRSLLDYPDSYIATKMGVNKGNYSKYMSGHSPITKRFIRKFYTAFSDEISTIKLKGQKTDPSIQESLCELSRRIDHLQQICDQLAAKGLK